MVYSNVVRPICLLHAYIRRAVRAQSELISRPNDGEVAKPTRRMRSNIQRQAMGV